jgi:hypothetical protein
MKINKNHVVKYETELEQPNEDFTWFKPIKLFGLTVKGGVFSDGYNAYSLEEAEKHNRFLVKYSDDGNPLLVNKANLTIYLSNRHYEVKYFFNNFQLRKFVENNLLGDNWFDLFE